MYYASQVFGISREIPINYVSREKVEDLLRSSLTKDQHIVVFGSSKQGKTCLRKECFKDEDTILIHCSNKWNLAQLNAAILKRAGFEITSSSKRTLTGKSKIVASIKSVITGLSGGVELEGEVSNEKVKLRLELDVEDVNDVVDALNEIKFDKYIILEDFHYLSTDTQKDFAIGLKAFHENSSITFVIIGVWLEENRLIVHNGDLTGRVTSINADRWNDDELKSVIVKGQKFLNVVFDDIFIKQLLHWCCSSVYIVQESCFEACIQEEIIETQKERKEIGYNLNVNSIIENVVNRQSARYKSFIINFSDGFQDTELSIYKWIIGTILSTSSDELDDGLKFAQIKREIQQKHPRKKDINSGSISKALRSILSLQIKKNIKPIILDYNETSSKLSVVDRGFLIWLKFQSPDDLFEWAGLPKSYYHI